MLRWIIVGLLLTAPMRLATAHVSDDDMAVLGPSMQELMDATDLRGFKCCTGMDISVVYQRRVAEPKSDSIWTHWEVMFPKGSNATFLGWPPEEGHWYQVPKTAMSKSLDDSKNRPGVAIAWWYPQGAAPTGSPIRCFVPGIEV